MARGDQVDAADEKGNREHRRKPQPAENQRQPQHGNGSHLPLFRQNNRLTAKNRHRRRGLVPAKEAVPGGVGRRGWDAVGSEQARNRIGASSGSNRSKLRIGSEQAPNQIGASSKSNRGQHKIKAEPARSGHRCSGLDEQLSRTPSPRGTPIAFKRHVRGRLQRRIGPSRDET